MQAIDGFSAGKMNAWNGKTLWVVLQTVASQGCSQGCRLALDGSVSPHMIHPVR